MKGAVASAAGAPPGGTGTSGRPGGLKPICVRTCLAVFAFLLLHLLARAWSPGGPWGVDTLAYLPPWIGLAFLPVALCLLLALSWWLARPGPARWCHTSAPLIRGPALAGLLILGGALFWWLREAIPLLGDGYLYLQEMEAGAWDVALRTDRAPLAFWLARGLYHLVSQAGGSAATAYRLFSIVSGLGFIGLAVWAASRLARSRAEAFILPALLLGQGYIQVFFGHIENYAILLTGALLYLLLGIFAARDEGSLWPPAVTLTLLLPVHLLSAVFVPSFALLTVRRIRSTPGPDRVAKVRQAAPLGVVLVGGPLLALVFGLDTAVLSGGLKNANLLPLAGTLGFLEPYHQLSLAHLWDILNQQLLAAPAAVVALCLVWRSSNSHRDAVGTFLLAATVFPLLLAAVLNPHIGAFRDWDMLAFTGLPFTLWAATVLIGRLRAEPRSLPVLACVPLAAVLHTGLWVWVNADRAASLDRYQTQLAGSGLSRHARAYGWETAASCFRDSGQLHLAVASAEKMVEASPANPRYRVFLGNLLFSAGAHDRAISQYESASRLGWEGKSLARSIADANYRMGRFEKAGAGYVRALEETPEDAALWANLGSACLATGHLEEAVSAFGRAAVLAPDKPGHLYNLGCALIRQNRPGEALQAFRDAVAHGMDTAEVRFDAGNALYGLRRYREAIREYGAALERSPDLLGAVQNLGSAYLAVGEYRQAAREYEKALSVDAGNAGLWYNLATAYRGLGRTEEARDALRRVLSIDPGHPLASQAYRELQNAP